MTIKCCAYFIYYSYYFSIDTCILYYSIIIYLIKRTKYDIIDDITTYELSKYLCTIISPLLGKSSSAVKNSFEFSEFVNGASYRTNDAMISFDVVSLFTNVPVEVATEVAKNLLCGDQTLKERTKLSVSDIAALLEFCLSTTEFTFRERFFRQKFGCPMGSPVSMVVANLVMENLEMKLQPDFIKFDVLHWKRFVDDTWCVLPRKNVSSFLERINSVERTIKFTIEEEKDGCIPFLDVLVQKNVTGSFSTTIYQKPTNTNRYLQFNSSHPLSQKRGVVKSLIHRAQTIPSTRDEKEIQMKNVMDTLQSNGYPQRFLQQSIRHSNDERHPETRKRISLPYVAGISEKISRCLRQSNLGVCFKPFNKICDILPRPKDPIGDFEKCGVVYNIPCQDCSLSYVGQTTNSLKTRISQHKAAVRLLQTDKSALAEHSLSADHRIDWQNAGVLAQERSLRKRLFLESFYSHKRSPVLNRCELPVPSVFLTFIHEQYS